MCNSVIKLSFILFLSVNYVVSVFLYAKIHPWYFSKQKHIQQQSHRSPNLPLIKKYDFIIVGAGPAGCVLANRLSENKNWNILLVEAGQFSSIVSDVPIAAAYLQSTPYNWDYLSEPQEGVCLAMENQKCGLPRGKGVGGSSLINYMIYNRGNSYDFDSWSQLGNKGWSYEEVLPYFLKSEAAQLNGLENTPYHNTSGPLNVEYVPYRTKMAKSFLKATKQAGYAETDYNGKNQLGIGYVQANTRRGARHSAASAYITPIRNRKNLDIIINAHVTKVLINQKKIAYGVEFIKNQQYYKAKSRKEIILSSGAFNSPQILMLSGIGPSEHLKKFDINVIQDLPVGRSLWDHMSHFGPTIVLNTTGYSVKFEELVQFRTISDFLNGAGPLTSIGGVESLTFMKTKNSSYPPSVPDLELIFSAGTYATDHGTAIRKGMKITQSVYDAVYKPLENQNIDAFTILIMLFHPKSKGFIELGDRNPLHPPKIFANFFENEEDIDTILQGIREVERIIQYPALKKLGAKVHDLPLPNCKQFTFASDDYWKCSIRTLSATLHHQVGTCKMGPVTDKTAVVNDKLQVHGVRRLRVVDTSIIPLPITGHTNADSFMIGEKASDMIKQKWS